MAEVHRMEALSPRSANIQMKPKLLKQKEAADEEAKKAEAVRKALKEKDYAPPPPEWVLQPPMAKGGLAEKYRTGKCLGKGGFAICYEGELRSKKSGTGPNVFALKVVKTKMNQKKMEEKVCILCLFGKWAMTDLQPVPYGATDSCENAASKYSRVSSRLHFQGEYVCCPRALLEWFGHGYGEKEKMSKPPRGTKIHSPALRSDQIHACTECDTPRS